VSRRASTAKWIAAGLAGAAGFLVLRSWVPPPGTRFTVCLLRRFTGLPCPGCGMTRAFAHLAKGEWAAAAVDHPFAFVLAVELGLAWLAWGTALVRGRPVRMPPWFERAAFVHLLVLTSFWLGRLSTGTLPW
jgi:Protein of unknown function (DUF2752)